MFGWGCYRDKEGKKFFHPSYPSNVSGYLPTQDIKKQQNTPLMIRHFENKSSNKNSVGNRGWCDNVAAVEIACGSCTCLVSMLHSLSLVIFIIYQSYITIAIDICLGTL